MAGEFLRVPAELAANIAAWMRQNATRRHAWLAVNAVIMALWLGLPLAVGIAQPDREASESENRNLAQWPDPPQALAEIPAWLPHFADYLKDQVGLREIFTTVHARALYAAGVSSNPSVILGKKGFLFERTINQPDDYLAENFGTLRLTVVELDALIERIADNADKASAIGIPYLVAIVPNKAAVYRNRLPDRYGERVSDERMVTQVARASADRGLPVLDLSETLQRAARDRLVWLRHDTHWNAAGAWAAYQAIVKAFHTMYGTSILSDRSEGIRFDEIEVTDGDLIKLLGLRGASETSLAAIFPAEPRTIAREEIKDGPRLVGLVMKTDFADGPRVMVLADSFIWKFLQFIGASSSEILWLRNADFTIQWDRVAQFKPDLILSLNTEKALIEKYWLR